MKKRERNSEKDSFVTRPEAVIFCRAISEQNLWGRKVQKDKGIERIALACKVNKKVVVSMEQWDRKRKDQERVGNLHS